MLNCWNWDAVKRPGFKELRELLKKEDMQTDDGIPKPLLSWIDELNEVNSESYNRIVERRDSIEVTSVKNETAKFSKNSHSSSSQSHISLQPIVRVDEEDVGHNVNFCNGKANGSATTAT